MKFPKVLIFSAGVCLTSGCSDREAAAKENSRPATGTEVNIRGMAEGAIRLMGAPAQIDVIEGASNVGSYYTIAVNVKGGGQAMNLSLSAVADSVPDLTLSQEFRLGGPATGVPVPNSLTIVNSDGDFYVTDGVATVTQSSPDNFAITFNARLAQGDDFGAQAPVAPALVIEGTSVGRALLGCQVPVTNEGQGRVGVSLEEISWRPDNLSEFCREIKARWQ